MVTPMMHGSEMMIMKKKTLVISGTCFILIIAGGCYYSTYPGMVSTNPVVTTLADQKDYRDQGSAAIGLENNAEHEEQRKESKEDGIASEPDRESSRIYIHLCGAVRKPAVYKVEAGARLVDVISLAEGLTEDAAGEYMNQAMLVEDGQRIYIPTKDEVEELTPNAFIVGEGDSGRKESNPELIDINRANARELMELPGIGESKAESIIAYRNANGEFSDTTELMSVPGIKEGLFGQMKDYITVN